MRGRNQKRKNRDGKADGTCNLKRVLSLKNKIALSKANITHVVTVLRMSPPVVKDEYLESLKRLTIDVDDVDDENLLQHFPTATKFIQSGLDDGGNVLIHWLVCFFYALIHVVTMQSSRSLAKGNTCIFFLGGVSIANLWIHNMHAQCHGEVSLCYCRYCLLAPSSARQDDAKGGTSYY